MAHVEPIKTNGRAYNVSPAVFLAMPPQNSPKYKKNTYICCNKLITDELWEDDYGLRMN